MAEPLITVAFPAYNQARFIAEAIKSVLSQGIKNIEVIVIDDASTDNTVAIVEEIAARDSRVRLMCNLVGLGPCGAFHKYLCEMHGEYIALLSSDDIFAPGKLAAQLDYLQQHPDAAMVAAAASFIDEQSNPITHQRHYGARLFDAKVRDRGQWLRYFFNCGNTICATSVMLRTDVLRAHALPDPRLMQLHDYDCWVRLVLAGYDIGMIEKPLVYCRIHDNQANLGAPTRSTRARCLFEHIEVLKRYYALTSINDLILMLPDENHTVPPGVNEEAYIQHRLSLYAWSLATPQHRMFALNNWYRLLGQEAWRDGLDILGVNARFLAIKSADYPLARALAATPKGILRQIVERSLPPALFNKLVRWIKNRRAE